ncbi:hypothetical protein DFH09DRAFT_968813 [Mycena vulgaris]|nr:hypothetical protein DFH09DRAFT_968813 [Mycena vulgaris]
MAVERNQGLPTLPGHPAHITIRAGSSRPESPQPSVDSEPPPDDAHTRPLRDVSPPRLPADAEIVRPPGVLTDSPTQHDAPTLPRQSIYRNTSAPSQRRRSELDWIIPVEPKRDSPRLKTLQERIGPTLETAKTERDKYALKAKMTGYALNIAIGLQVALGALTTGLSAVTTGRQTSVVTAFLGGLSTIAASYLARARGSNEPELSITRRKDLDQYIRECEIFVLDYGHLTSNEHDSDLNNLRSRFEDLLGHANGERRLSSV